MNLYKNLCNVSSPSKKKLEENMEDRDEFLFESSYYCSPLTESEGGRKEGVQTKKGRKEYKGRRLQS